MKLISKELVSLEYRDQVRQDLARAKICRFLVAYVSLDGLDSIGRHLLTRALRDQSSFGVASLSCSCGFEPLLKLQRDLPELRLKYFMDPIVKEPTEPDDIALFHSKLLYLFLEREQKSIIYIGSHNWTRRALGAGGPRNAEASMRFELDFVADDLGGTGTSLASEVNRHLLAAWNSQMCLPATEANRVTFEEWFAKGCRRQLGTSLQDTTIVLAVLKTTGTPPGPAQWLQLQGRGIYLQALEELDGQKVWTCGDRLLVLIWDSDAALQTARQPIILQCGVTTYNACPGSELRSTNKSDNPVKGFEAIILDTTLLASRKAKTKGARVPVRIWSGRDVNVFDFQFPSPTDDSVVVDNGVTPKYRFHLEVERVVFPADGPQPPDPKLVWPRETFAVADNKKSARYQDKPGFYVEPKLRDAMLRYMHEVLLIKPDQAKVLPFSEVDDATLGKRISQHPLHETYIGKDYKERSKDFYSKAPLGALVADLAEPPEPIEPQPSLVRTDEPLSRVQKVFTMLFSDLFEVWENIAQQWSEHTRQHPPKQ
jgi:hypothetical protein